MTNLIRGVCAAALAAAMCATSVVRATPGGAHDPITAARIAHEAAAAQLGASAGADGIASVAAVKDYEKTALALAAVESEAAAAAFAADPDFIATQRRLARSTSVDEQRDVFAEAKAEAVLVEVVQPTQEGGRP
jgi:hypothetical protein